MRLGLKIEGVFVIYRHRKWCATFLSTPIVVKDTTSMPEYPGQDLSLEQLFCALNAKILEQTQICQSSVPGLDQQRWVSTRVSDPSHTLQWIDDEDPVSGLSGG